MRLAVVGVAADVVAEQEETPDDVVELGRRSETCSACPSATQPVQAPAKQSACVSSWMLLAAKPNRPCTACPNSCAMTTGTRNRP